MADERTDDSLKVRSKEVDLLLKDLEKTWGLSASVSTWESGDIEKEDGKAGYSEPLQLFDTHPNKRFKEGDRVVYAGAADFNQYPMVVGTVIGHVAEDRLMVRWPHIVAQAEVDELLNLNDTPFGTTETGTEDLFKDSQMLASKEFSVKAHDENIGADVPSELVSDIPEDESLEHGKLNPKLSKWAHRVAAHFFASGDSWSDYLTKTNRPMQPDERKAVATVIASKGKVVS